MGDHSRGIELQVSATNRGADRITADNYPTPPWATRRLVEVLKTHYGVDIHHASILEPCCGEGAIIRVLRAEGARGHIMGIDTRVEALPYARGSGASRVLENHAQNFIASPGFNLAITNPPFDQAADRYSDESNTFPGIINRTLQNASVCAFLLRASFRLGAWRNNMPDEFRFQQRLEFIASYCCKFITSNGNKVDGCGWAEKVPLAERIAECPDCKSKILQRSSSDSAEYSWFIWAERGRPQGTLRIIPDTALLERKTLEAAA